MMDIRKQTPSKTSPQTKLRNYTEVTEYLDAHWSVNKDSKTLDRIKQLDAAFEHPSRKLSTLFVAGTNGKSLTAYLTTKLLKAEGLKVGTFSSPHLLTYNERLAINLEAIPNKAFTDIGNDVINMAESLGIDAYSNELLTLMALLYFVDQKIDVAVLEVSQGGAFDAVNICHPFAATITRITPTDVDTTESELAPIIKETMGIIKKGTYLVSGDQSKNNLQLMNDLTDTQGGQWAMPIRKLAPLNYPFEQLHGRCAALAERLAQTFMERYYNKNVTITADSLLSKQKGKRGRPTREDKRKSEQQPKKTLDQYWKEEVIELPGRFQTLDKDKPPVLLDTASNLDAFQNVLLGVRLLHYARPLKGLSIIMAAARGTMHCEEFLKLVRYFFKKTSGTLYIVPLEEPLIGVNEEESWDTEKVTNDLKSMKIKTRMCKSFAEAMELAKKPVDERNGLIVVTGSRSVVNSYWRYKGVKKF